MYIACKYEEIYPVKISEFVYINDGSCTQNDIVKMENVVLNILGFDLSSPTSEQFVSHFVNVSFSDHTTQLLAMFLSELSLTTVEKMHSYTPSSVGAACVALARITLGFEKWPRILVDESGMDIEDFHDCLLSLHRLHLSAKFSEHQEIQTNYNTRKTQYVALIKPLAVVP